VITIIYTSYFSLPFHGKSGSYFILELVNLSPLFFNPFSFFLQKRGRNIITIITVFSKLLGGGAVVQCIARS